MRNTDQSVDRGKFSKGYELAFKRVKKSKKKEKK